MKFLNSTITFYQSCFENEITITTENITKTLCNRIFKIGMFGRIEKNSFSFNERKVVYSASLSDGRLNQALAKSFHIGASAKAFPRGKGDHVSGG